MTEISPRLAVGRILGNEIFLFEVILFAILFGALFQQAWDNLFLPLFPVILFGEAVFFRVFQIGQESNYSGYRSPYETLGLGKKCADRLEFAAMLTLITILLEGYDSLARPQLAASEAPYFLEVLVLAYLLGNYWIFSSLNPKLKSNAAREITHEVKMSTMLRSKGFFEEISPSLKISTYSAILYFILFAVGIIFTVLSALDYTPALQVTLPGSSLPSGTPIAVSGVFYVILIAPPIFTFTSTWIVFTKSPLPPTETRLNYY